jgi:RNA polymerase sigma-70 factor (ECF subfamily)
MSGAPITIFTSTSPLRFGGDVGVIRRSAAPTVLEDREREATIEKQLVSAAQRGDEAAFEQLVHRYDRVVFRLALQFTGSQQDAHDIYQETFIKVYRNLTRFRLGCSFHTWIYRIVANLCVDSWRKKQLCKERQPVVESHSGESYSVIDTATDHRVGSDPERELLRHELRAQIDDALKTLTPRERVVFHLRHDHGLRVHAVAGILNTTDEAVKNVLHRATKKLRVILANIQLNQ